jgi:hypothetical protein
MVALLRPGGWGIGAAAGVYAPAVCVKLSPPLTARLAFPGPAFQENLSRCWRVVYFRMLFVGYFEGIDSQRGIDWRCADSLALREFLGVPLGEATAGHSTLTVTRQRLPQEVHNSVFEFVLKLASDKKLLDPKTIAVDSTLLKADAAMKSIVRRDTGTGYKEYVKRLAAEADVAIEDDGAAAVRQEAEGEDLLERGLGVEHRLRGRDHADEGRPHALGVQGGACGGS